MDRSRAEELDRSDPLASFRGHFPPPAGPIYLDGNSLGRPPAAVVAAIAAGVEAWTSRLVAGWDEWVALPTVVGDELGALIGAGAGQVVVCDSTTVNLYKVVAAALDARPGRTVVLGDGADFPTDRYVLAGLARERGRRLHLIDGDGSDPAVTTASVEDRLDGDVAVVCLSHVNYRSSARLDVARVTRAAHRAGALVVWDLCHSAGAVPVHLDDWGVDFAVGCTYKYLNAGPGAPGFLYVDRSLQDRVRQPIQGWFGQHDRFAMGDTYCASAGPAGFLTGTPGVIGLLAVRAALAVTAAAGVDRLWAKSEGLTGLLAGMIAERLVPHGARMASPEQRGAHVAVAHPRAWAWCRTLIERGLVHGDFRGPDVLRLGPAPLYTRYVDCWDAVAAMEQVLAAGLPDVPPPGAGRAT